MYVIRKKGHTKEEVEKVENRDIIKKNKERKIAY